MMKEASVMNLLEGSYLAPREGCHIRGSVLACAVGSSQIQVGEEKALLFSATPFLPAGSLGNCIGWWGNGWLTATGYVILYI